MVAYFIANPTVPPYPKLLCSLSIYSSEAISVRFAAIGVGVVERLHLLIGSQFFSGLLFPRQLSAVVEQVTRQQEASKREDQQAEVDLQERKIRKMDSCNYDSRCQAIIKIDSFNCDYF